MKIGTITFHSSYNFGSNLQAYALQEYIKKIAVEENIECDYKIINLRTKTQRDMYDYRATNNFLKKILIKMLYKNKLEKREKNYEDFINNKLNLTKEYSSDEELKKENFDFDYYISGSDQLWNLAALDFDWAYYLNFVKSPNKISYAASFGPVKRDIFNDNKDKISKYLKQYKYISVREEDSAQNVEKFIGKKPQINIDPTLLLTKDEWLKIIDKTRIIKEDYILFYTLKMNRDRVKFLKKISKKLKLKIVVANPAIKYDIMGGFIKKYESGPIEFLNLIYNAKLIISSSFHGTVFSILLNKDFYTLDGINDSRISTLLKKTNLEERNIFIDEDLDKKLKSAYNVDFSKVNQVLDIEREESKRYLKKALDIGV